MASKTRTRKPKRKSGRRIVADLLESSRCRCGSRATITMARQTSTGTKWKHYCDDCRPQRKEA